MSPASLRPSPFQTLSPATSLAMLVRVCARSMTFPMRRLPSLLTSASHAITIQGSPQEVGDAVIAVRQWIAKHRIRLPHQSTHSALGAPSDPPNPTPRPLPSTSSCGMASTTPWALATTLVPSGSSFRWCRQDISPMCKSPIWTGFDPLDVPHLLQVQNPAIRVLFLIRFPEALQNLPLTSHKIKFNRAILTIILPCPYLPWGTSNRNYHISAQNRSYPESPDCTWTYYTSLERYF